MSDYVGRQLITVTVPGTDMEAAAAALREKLAKYPDARVTALTQRSTSMWAGIFSQNIQLLAAIEYTE
ncbi:hypothetical protein CLV85_0112 [Salinibacterium amurskyense]|uniref:Uncharacterized protein n=1 Tax=Salinibacterium amurskyense TaxID=205941 RepID=A0A2M9D5E8_9MICO|nr:hypothetical protein [Salinibacterium amurskyense]PJJ80945.1 hypothetical protein CLV85_0112 [Salinibacterium amurskyense]RLQ82986.1 hypothetical protein D9C83_00560 [Salinibacterium amurskyense]GHD81992.1 hypothetical protein GCM10007394_16930 [Salinibacterium amurskyense]